MGKKTSLPKPARDNRANQLNPNNAAYWRSRGLNGPTSTETSKSPSKRSTAQAPTKTSD